MKKLILILFSLVVCFEIAAQDNYAKLLEKANTSKDDCLEFYDVLSDQRTQSSTAEGYFALATMMLAKTHANPFTKLSYFNKGKQLLETNIESNPENVELRFLRYAVQAKVPAILLYFNDMEEDKQILEGYLASNNDNLADRIARFFDMNKS